MSIRVEHICKSYGSDFALQDICLQVNAGEIVSIIGPSGSGKTTLLNIIAGLLEADSGTVYIHEANMMSVPTEQRRLGIVLQGAALYPNMNVYQNIAFPLQMLRTPKREIPQKVQHIAELLQIGHLLKRRPSQLSGGEQQRVAIARAFVKEPEIMLFDEPFSNLDLRLALELREELKSLLKAHGTTAIFVTHSQDDAISISDRIAVLQKGQLLQYAAPGDIYHRPSCTFVANFVGRYPINSFRGTVNDGIFTSHTGGIRLASDSLKAADGEKILMFRPEHALALTEPEPDTLSGVITDLFTDGKENILSVRIGADLIRLYAPVDMPLQVGQPLSVRINTAQLLIFSPEGSACDAK